MDLKNYVYAKLAPEEFYKENDDVPRISKISRISSVFGQSQLSLFEKKESKSKKRILSTLDILISLFIVTPMVVGNWRGIYQLMDIYGNYFPPMEGLLWANFAHLVFALCQNVLHYLIIEKKYRNCFLKFLNFIIVKCYTLLFACISILQCRCGWMIMDKFCGVLLSPTGNALMEGSSTSLWFTMICTLILFCLKGLNNVASPPFVIALDLEDEIFLFRIRYFSKIGEKTSLYVLDCIFSVFVVGTLVVFVWRGVWILLDILLFPEDDTLSAWGSLVIGYAVVAMAFLLQPLMRCLCDRLTGSPRLLVADFFVLFAFFGTVNVWRGIWNLLNIYFLPENIELSCWITHWVCLLILILLGCSNSLLVRGVYIDAEEPAGKCVIFPCYYLRVIFQEDKLKKLHLPTLNFEDGGAVKVQNKTEKSEKPVENNHHNLTVPSISINVTENHT